jgi:hypothetical protein
MPHYIHTKVIDADRFEVTTWDGEVLLAEIRATQAHNEDTGKYTVHPSVHLYHQGVGHLIYAAGIDTNRPFKATDQRMVYSDSPNDHSFTLGYSALLDIWRHAHAFVDMLKIEGVFHHDVPSI